MKKYLKYVIKKTEALCKIPSPSGFTKNILYNLINELKLLRFNPEITRKDSIVVEIGGEGNSLILAAHIDTLGLMVRSIKPNGRLRFTKIGGYPENNID